MAQAIHGQLVRSPARGPGARADRLRPRADLARRRRVRRL